MSSFDYNAPAELFLAKRTKSSRKNYQRFTTGAEAIRYAVEDLRTPQFVTVYHKGKTQGADDPMRIGVTIGVAMAPRDGLTLERLAACADAALYQAKHKGRGGVVFAGAPPASSAAATAA